MQKPRFTFRKLQTPFMTKPNKTRDPAIWHEPCNLDQQRCRSSCTALLKAETSGGIMENIIITTYAAYIMISVVLTVWVARTLHKNGRVFLVEVFNGDDALADSVNHLLVVGFYLINFGYVTLALKIMGNLETYRAGVEALSYKIGLVLLVLGGM